MTPYLDSRLRAGDAAEAASTRREEASALLTKYPNLNADDLTRLTELYRAFSALDTALILSDGAIAPKLDQFTAENRSKLRLPFRQYAGLLFYTGLTLVAVVWVLATA